MSEPRMKSVTIDIKHHINHQKLGKAIEALQALNEEYGPDVEIFVDIDYDYDGSYGASVQLEFFRPETPAEIEQRERLEEYNKKIRLARYEKLKKEFGE